MMNLFDGVDEKIESKRKIGELQRAVGSKNVDIDESVARLVLGDQFIELLTSMNPGVLATLEITREGMMLGRVTIAR